jgi:hypothetical protein
LPPKADIRQRIEHVCFVPEADIFDLPMIFASAASARLIERNRPSMFAHPVWSFQCDVRMLRLWLGGRLNEERARAE